MSNHLKSIVAGGVIGIFGALSGVLVSRFINTDNFKALEKDAKNTSNNKDTIPNDNVKVTVQDDKVKVTVQDAAGGKTVLAELPKYPSLSRLIPVLAAKMGLPTNVSYGIQHIESGRLVLDNDETLDSAGVKSGDTIRLLPDVIAGAGIPIRSFRDIQLVEAVMNHSDVLSRTHRRKTILAVFLYTEEDKELASYIRNNIGELHYMTGSRCMFFTIEKPAPEWDEDIRKSLGALAGDYFDALWERLGTDSFKPFDKKQAYGIGERFGIQPMQFPCIVFFSELKNREVTIVEINKFIDPNSQELNTEYTRFFRVLFSVIRQSVNESRDKQPIKLGNLLAEEWQRTTQQPIKLVESKELTVSLIEVIGAVVKAFF